MTRRPLLLLVIPLLGPLLLVDAAAPVVAETPTPTATPTSIPTSTPTVVPDPADPPPEELRAEQLRRTTKRTWVVRGVGEVHGERGVIVDYSVEIQGAVPARLRRAAELLAHVERVFADERGWTGTGARRLRRIGTPAGADVRIVLAPSWWVDRECGRKGMRTVGRYSCWTGRYAALNLRRWNGGMRRFPSLDSYRTYLINHEFGHGLDFGHRGCPRRGARAPVMLPQSRSLYGCRPNGWPHP